MIAASFSQGLPCLVLAASLVWRAGLAQGGLWASSVPLAASLALGLAGLGSAVVRLAWPALIGREWVLEAPIAVAVALWALRSPRPVRGAMAPGPTRRRSAAGMLLGACLAVSAAAAVAALVQNFILYPHGETSDAYFVWNLKARFLYRGGADVRHLFDPLLDHTHPSYPLLLPGLIARFWNALGHDSPWVPQAVALSSFGLVVGLLVAILHSLRGWTTGCLAGLSVLSLPFFIDHASSQYADLPLSLFALAAFGCFAIAAECPGLEPGALALAGAFAGLAAWTKTEGFLVLLGLLGAVGVLRLRAGVAAALRGAGWLLAASLPLLGALYVANAAYVETRTAYASQSMARMVELALSPDRHGLILSAALRFTFGSEQWLALALLALAAVAGRLARRGSPCPAQRPLLTALGVVAAGFYLVYLVNPYPLDYMLKYSVNRLFVQYWPSLVLAVFSGARLGPGDDSGHGAR